MLYVTAVKDDLRRDTPTSKHEVGVDSCSSRSSNALSLDAITIERFC